MACFQDVPPEVFYAICAYLSAGDLVSLKAVCHIFSSFLNSSFWKKRLLYAYEGAFPCIPAKKVDWITANLDHENCVSLCGASHCGRSFVFPYAVSFGIDAMHIPPVAPGLLVVGDRGRSITAFSFDAARDGNSWIPLFVDCRKHTGWIWTIVSSGHSLLTGSWDGTLLHWALSSSGLQLQTAYKLSAQVLCSAFMDPHTVAVGANHWVHIIDIRAPPLSQTGIRLLHKKAVLCMDCRNSGSPATLPYDTGTWNWGGFPASGDCISSCNESLSDLSSIGASLEDLPSLLGLIEIDPDVQPEESSGDKPSVSLDPSMPNTVPSLPSEGPCVSSVVSSAISLFTGSNDRTLSGWDLRNPSKAVKSYQFSNYPRKMSLMDDDELWVAEPPGRIHVFDVREGRLDCVHTNEIPGWTRGFGELRATPGCIFASGLHGVVQAFHPTNPLIPVGAKPIAEGIPQTPTAMTVDRGLLVVGAGDGTIYIWSSRANRNGITC